MLLSQSAAMNAGFMLTTWECILVNLGHVYRKAHQWDAAIECYMKALGLAPGQASTYSALAYTHHLKVDPNYLRNLQAPLKSLSISFLAGLQYDNSGLCLPLLRLIIWLHDL